MFVKEQKNPMGFVFYVDDLRAGKHHAVAQVDADNFMIGLNDKQRCFFATFDGKVLMSSPDISGRAWLRKWMAL